MTAIASHITSLTIVYSTIYSKKTSKLRVTGLCVGNSPVTGEFPAQMASNAENVSIWWRHHVSWVIRKKMTVIYWERTILFTSIWTRKITSICQAEYRRRLHKFMKKIIIHSEQRNLFCCTVRFVPSHVFLGLFFITSTDKSIPVVDLGVLNINSHWVDCNNTVIGPSQGIGGFKVILMPGLAR